MVQELSWSCDSSVLLIWCLKPCGTNVLQFRIIGNYHWYLKHALDVEGKILTHIWASEDSNLVRRLIRKGSIEEFRTMHFSWSTDISQGVTSSDLSMVVGVDGSCMKVKQVVFPVCCLVEEQEDLLSRAGGGINSLMIVTKSRLLLFTISIDYDSSKNAIQITGAGGNGFVMKCRNT